jgi:hypothetical protein
MFQSPFRRHWSACRGHKSLYHMWWTSKGLTLKFLKCLLSFLSNLKIDVIFYYAILVMGRGQTVFQYIFMAYPCLFSGRHLSIRLACLYIDSAYVHINGEDIVITIPYKWHGFFFLTYWVIIFLYQIHFCFFTLTYVHVHTYTHSFIKLVAQGLTLSIKLQINKFCLLTFERETISYSILFIFL